MQGVIHFLCQRLKMDAQFEIRRYVAAAFRPIEDDLAQLGLDRSMFE